MSGCYGGEEGGVGRLDLRLIGDCSVAVFFNKVDDMDVPQADNQLSPDFDEAEPPSSPRPQAQCQ